MGFEQIHPYHSDPEFSGQINETTLSRSGEQGLNLVALSEDMQVQAGTESLKKRVGQIPSSCIEFLKDSKWMAAVVSLFGIASRTCSLIGSTAGNYVPYLSIASSPFYLYHSTKSARERIKLAKTAAKVSNGIETTFWASRGVDSVGSAINDIVKPFAGASQIFGFEKIAAVGITFSLVIPIILIVCSVIGGIAEGWAMRRSIKSLHEFNEKSVKADASLEGLESMLSFLNGPQESFISQNMEQGNYELALQQFNDTHFTGDDRRESIQGRVQPILESNFSAKIKSIKANIMSSTKPLHSEECVQLKNLTEGVGRLFEGFTDPEMSVFEQLETLISLNEQMIYLFEDEKYSKIWKSQMPFVQNLSENMRQNTEELIELKTHLIEGKEMIDSAHSELHRVLLNHAITLLSSLLAFIAGVIILSSPSLHIAGSALAITSASISILKILFEKFISQERFLELERFLEILKQENL